MMLSLLLCIILILPIYSLASCGHDVHTLQTTSILIPQVTKEVKDVENINVVIADTTIMNDGDRSCYSSDQDYIDRNGNSQPCTPDDVVTSAMADNVITTIAQVKNNLANAVQLLDPPGSPLSVPSQCNDIQVPSEWSSNGIDGHLGVLMTMRPGTPAFAASSAECARDQNDRPILGHINIAPRSLHHATDSDPSFLERTILHQMIHVLGFSQYKFSQFRDSNGILYQEPVISQRRTINRITKDIKYLTTPTLLAEVRSYFSCDELPGAELEEWRHPVSVISGDLMPSNASEAAYGSHWESRLFPEDIMAVRPSPSLTNNYQLSRLTLAALEDSGWYGVDYKTASSNTWGQGLGCGFSQEPCNKWGTFEAVGLSGYHCTDNTPSACTFDLRAKGSCDIQSWPSATLSPYYRSRGASSVLGGRSPFLDFCPVVRRSSGSDCTDPANTPEDAAYATGEHYGSFSRCFRASLVRDGFSVADGPIGNRCFAHACNQTHVFVRLGQHWLPCPNPGNGGRVPEEAIPGWQGELYCPSYGELCGGSGTTTNLGEVEEEGLVTEQNDGDDSVSGASEQYTANGISRIILTAIGTVYLTMAALDWL
eukprot:gb/GECH01014476.1/.p1 GENE.gb/GECH01014476.1/~~gb/GECH01014476.1/.p1  ORF type:complete len:597 (+),score=98.17 gb/GECH01014476.1/:1-1791(+)